MADQGTGQGRPAGWQKDPSCRHYGRWWDGSQWTEHVISAEKVQSVDSLPPGPESAIFPEGAPPPPAAPNRPAQAERPTVQWRGPAPTAPGWSSGADRSRGPSPLRPPEDDPMGKGSNQVLAGLAGWWNRLSPRVRLAWLGVAVLAAAAMVIVDALDRDVSKPVAATISTTLGVGTSRVPTTENQEKAEIRRLVAFDVCKDFVKRRLKAPSTAKFRNPLQDDGEVAITGSGNGPFTIRSTVDAENSFGAKPRSTFTCVVTLNGDTWNLDNLIIS